MKKIFLDTNILLDWVLQREQALYAATILQLGKNGEIELYASYLTIANMAYILRKTDIDKRYHLISEVMKLVHILPTDKTQIDRALQQKVDDFEDMLQYQCCLSGGCEAIVTNNTKHFAPFCKIPYLTSSDFLLTLP